MGIGRTQRTRWREQRHCRFLSLENKNVEEGESGSRWTGKIGDNGQRNVTGVGQWTMRNVFEEMGRETSLV